MAIKLYMNQHVPKAITAGLRLRDVDVVTAFYEVKREGQLCFENKPRAFDET
jgi:hypothetical protein